MISFYLHQNPFNHEHSNGKTQLGVHRNLLGSQRRKIIRYMQSGPTSVNHLHALRESHFSLFHGEVDLAQYLSR